MRSQGCSNRMELCPPFPPKAPANASQHPGTFFFGLGMRLKNDVFRVNGGIFALTDRDFALTNRVCREDFVESQWKFGVFSGRTRRVSGWISAFSGWNSVKSGWDLSFPGLETAFPRAFLPIPRVFLAFSPLEYGDFALKDHDCLEDFVES